MKLEPAARLIWVHNPVTFNPHQEATRALPTPAPGSSVVAVSGATRTGRPAAARPGFRQGARGDQRPAPGHNRRAGVLRHPSDRSRPGSMAIAPARQERHEPHGRRPQPRGRHRLRPVHRRRRCGQFGNWQRWTRDHHVAPQLVGPVWPPPPGTPGHDPSPPMREPEIWAEQMRADLTWVRRSRDQANDDNTRAIHDNTRAIIGGHPVIGRHVIMLGQPGDNTWRPDDLLLLIAVKSGRVGARVVLLFRPDEALLDWLAHAHSERRDAQFIYPTREPSAVGPVLSRPVVPNPRHRHRGRAQIPGGGLPPSLGHPGPARRHPRADHHLGRWRNADPHHPAGHYTRHRPRRTRRPRRPGRAPRHQHGAASRRGRRGRRDSRRSD